MKTVKIVLVSVVFYAIFYALVTNAAFPSVKIKTTPPTNGKKSKHAYFVDAIKDGYNVVLVIDACNTIIEATMHLQEYLAPTQATKDAVDQAVKEACTP